MHADMLCFNCLRIFHSYEKNASRLERQPHHNTFSSLTQSAQSGCLICCTLIGLGYSTSSTSYKFTPIDDAGDISYRDEIARMDSKFTPRSTGQAFSLRFYPEWGEFPISYRLDISKSTVERPQPPTNTGAYACLLQAKAWLDECLQKHSTSCPPPTDWMPTRLIDVGEDGLVAYFNGPAAKLIISSEDSPKGPYLTLSHRWGNTDIVKLTTANLVEIRGGLPISKLSKTFEDAIAVTRTFRIRYLWIDSLCIIQDSKEDWLREALMMSEVYKNSFCNLVAMGSENSSEGLFFDRKASLLTSSWVAVGPPASEQVYNLTVDKLLHKDDVAKAPLRKRGWVLQEQLLAPRALLFTKQQILWECPTHEACETYPEGLPPSYYRDAREMIRFHTPIPLPVHVLKQEIATVIKAPNKILSGHLQDIKSRSYCRGVGDVDGFWYIWKHIVEDFSSRELTVRDDRLVALAGIATSLHQRTGYRYLAGIWVREYAYSITLMELLWSSTSARLHSRPSKFRAPSWSWASVEGGIKYFLDTDVKDLDVSAYLTVPATDSPLIGQEKEVSIIIEGKLLTLELVREQLNHDDYPGSTYALFEDYYNAIGRNVYCLAFLHSYMAGDVWGLLLNRLENWKYERCGSFKVQGACGRVGWKDFNSAPRTKVEII